MALRPTSPFDVGQLPLKAFPPLKHLPLDRLGITGEFVHQSLLPFAQQWNSVNEYRR